MRNLIYAITGLILLFGCSSTKNTVTDQKTNVAVDNNVKSGINQTWTLIGYSAFMNPDDLPDFSKGYINYTFTGDSNYGQLTVVDNDPESKSEQASEPSQYWIEDCAIMVNGFTDFYTIDEIKDSSGKTVGSVLELDSNTDPSLSPDGGVKTFLNQELAQAAGYNPEGTKTITDFKFPSPKYAKALSGAWTLTSYSAYMSNETMDKLPKFSDGDVVWEFLEEDFRYIVRVTKSMEPHEYDYSMPAGDHNFWMRNCYIQIGSDLYSYALSDDGNSLTLQRGLDPSIADDEEYFQFKKF